VTDRETIAWLTRRVGFGPAPGELDELEALGVDGALDRLLAPAGSAPTPDDLWADLTLHSEESGERRRYALAAITRWIEALAATATPLPESMAWFWHGHLVTSILEVPYPILLARQINLFRQRGLGSFVDLLAATTVDPAMLLYLDGAGSTAEAPNENYGREMLELFALGIGNYGEGDVQAAARALTGYRIERTTGEPYVVPRAHDGGAQTLLGVEGVRDVAGVVDAVTGHGACAGFVARSVIAHLLGPEVDDALTDRLTEAFAAGGLELAPLVRSCLEAGVDGAAQPVVSGPTPWLVGALRATGAAVEARTMLEGLFAAGQLPWVPPNVGGWPGHTAWLTSATTVGRANLAGAVARGTPEDAPVLVAAAAGDHDALADHLGRPEGFGPMTRTALGEAARVGGRPGDAVLATALCAPEVVIR